MNTYWTLAPGPLGPAPTPETFERREAPIPSPGPGQALSRTIYISLDPYQWGYMQRGVTPAGAPCHARTVSQVLESRMEGFSAGDFVFNVNGWAQYGLMGEAIARPAYMIPRRLDPARGRISLAVGVLGMLGLTAYAGMILQGDPKAGETAVVSAASGGVGQIAGQLARLRGARVVGIAGREDKCRFVVDELGFDACVSHLGPTFASDLRAACPDGVDVYFENVGGAVFDAVLPLLNVAARVPVCGLIAHYNASALPPGPDRLPLLASTLLAKRIRMQGFIILDHYASGYAAFLKEMGAWVEAGKVMLREDIVDDLEQAPRAFIGLLEGENFGKLVIKVAEA